MNKKNVKKEVKRFIWKDVTTYLFGEPLSNDPIKAAGESNKTKKPLT